MTEHQIGYLCARGHFCFHADPDEIGECGSKSLGRVVFIPDDDLAPSEYVDVLHEADERLGEVYRVWGEQ